jgi:hypothetical protein
MHPERANLKYYQVVRRWLEELGPQNSILDVGCSYSTSVLFGNFRYRYALDLHKTPEIPGVIGIQNIWMYLLMYVDVITCLQVLEHVDNPKEFAEKLRYSSKITIVSLNWAPTEDHLHHWIDVPWIIHVMQDEPEKSEITTDNHVKRYIGIWNNEHFT